MGRLFFKTFIYSCLIITIGTWDADLWKVVTKDIMCGSAGKATPLYDNSKDTQDIKAK